jgi:hypothetical protein
MRIVDADGPPDCSASTNALADDYDRAADLEMMQRLMPGAVIDIDARRAEFTPETWAAFCDHIRATSTGPGIPVTMPPGMPSTYVGTFVGMHVHVVALAAP